MRGARGCITCPVGKFSSDGASECAAACPAGYEPDYAAPCLRGCTECGPGHFADGTSPCQVCSSGFYAEIARPYCASCTAGRFAAAAAATVCIACAAGFRSELPTESVACVSCQPGQYAYAAHGSDCADCSVGRYGMYIISMIYQSRGMYIILFSSFVHRSGRGGTEPQILQDMCRWKAQVSHLLIYQ